MRPRSHHRLRIATVCVLLVAPAAPVSSAAPAEPASAAPVARKLDPAVDDRGRQVYQTSCASCHDNSATRAPVRAIVELLTPDAIHRALTTGIMRPMAAGLSDADLRDVAQHLARRPMGSAGEEGVENRCSDRQARFDFNRPPAFPAWGMDHAGTHQIPDRVAGITPGNVGRLKLKWAFGFRNSVQMRSQPTFAGGAVFIGSHDGTVYALDAATGCVRWQFAATSEVRTGIVASTWRRGDTSARPRIYFGDVTGYVHALDARTGAQVWRVKADTHASTTLTGTPTLYGGLLYVPVSSLEEAPAADPGYPCCSFRGSVLALDPRDGQTRWRTWLTDLPQSQGRNASGVERIAPSGVAVWSSPVIDSRRGTLYVTTGDNYSSPSTAMSDAVISLDLRTGRIRWVYQALSGDAWNLACVRSDKSNCPAENGPDFDFGAGAVLARGRDGREYVLAGQKSGMAYAIDPDTGALVWKARVGRGGINGGVHFAIGAANGLFLVPISDVSDRRSYDIPARPGLFALDIATGNEVWAAPDPNACGERPFCKPGYAGAVSATSRLVMAGGSDGFLRIFDARSGELLWQTDTALAVPTVNQVPAHGGAMSGSTGPVAYEGMLFVPSGYGYTSKMPGNVLLVYAPQ